MRRPMFPVFFVGFSTAMQSVPSSSARLFSIKVRLSMCKCWSTDRPINRSSQGRYASATKKEMLRSASCPHVRWSTVRGTVLEREKVNDCACSSRLSATCTVTPFMIFMKPMPCTTAASVVWGEASESSLPSSQRAVASCDAVPSKTLAMHLGELWCTRLEVCFAYPESSLLLVVFDQMCREQPSLDIFLFSASKGDFS